MGGENAVSLRGLVVLAVGVLAVSTAAIFIRLAEAPPVVIATYRLLFASIIVVPLAIRRRRPELRALDSAGWRRALLSGAMLAAHFALWIWSLELTSVASSVVLVTTNPLWVGLAAPLVIGERTPPRLMAGIGVAFVGGLIIGWGDIGLGREALLGDLLALGGAWAAAAYFLIGRRLRAGMSLLAYVAVVYGTAAVLLLLAALALGLPLTGYPAATWGYLIALALVPQLLGHSSFNWALQHLSATFVSGSILGEALGSTLLAWWILAEPPPPLTVVGGTLILIGLALAVRAEARARRQV